MVEVSSYDGISCVTLSVELRICMLSSENALDGSSQNGVKDVYGSQYGSQGFYTNEGHCSTLK